MIKQHLIATIITRLETNLALFTAAALHAHTAATHEECQPDNKYDTTALEASYLAQGQANRTREIKVALDTYRSLVLLDFDDETPIRLTALITLEDENGTRRRLFLGPHAGGMKIPDPEGDIVVITPSSPLGGSLIGRQLDDKVQTGNGHTAPAFTIIAVS